MSDYEQMQKVCSKCSTPIPLGSNLCPIHGKYGGGSTLKQEFATKDTSIEAEVYRRIAERKAPILKKKKVDVLGYIYHIAFNFVLPIGLCIGLLYFVVVDFINGGIWKGLITLGIGLVVIIVVYVLIHNWVLEHELIWSENYKPKRFKTISPVNKLYRPCQFSEYWLLYRNCSPLRCYFPFTKCLSPGHQHKSLPLTGCDSECSDYQSCCVICETQDLCTAGKFFQMLSDHDAII